MRPRVMTREGEELSDGIVTLIVESEPENSTELFRYQYLKTHDPNERYDKMLEILQGSYFQRARALLGSHDGALRAALAARRPAPSRRALRSLSSNSTARATAFR